MTITNDGMMLCSKPLTGPDMMDLMLNGTMAVFQNILRNIPAEEQQAAKEEYYDMFNQAASAFLEAWIPEKELRPDLTAQAILEKENEILTIQAAKVEANPTLKLVADNAKKNG